MAENELVTSNLCPLCGGVMTSITHRIEASAHGEPVITSGHLCSGHPTPKHPIDERLEIMLFANPEKALRHDGTLRGRNTYTVQHIFSLEMPEVASIKIGHEETTSDEVWLSPEQALSLLGWLQQEEDTLMHIVEARTKGDE